MSPLSGTARGQLVGPRRAGHGQRWSPVPRGTGDHPLRSRPTGHRLVAVGLGLVVALGVVLAGPASPAYAHAQMVGSTPANGARLDTAPAEIVLRFSERVNLVRDGIRLLDARGAVRGTEPARLGTAAAAQVSLPVPAGLGAGIYTVSWRVVSADSHPIHGAFVFGVGDVEVGQLPDAGAATDADPPLAAVFWLFRWLGYSALALLAGGTAFLLFCWPSGWTQLRARRALLVGWVGSLACALVVLVLQGPYGAGASLSSVVDPALLSATLGTDYGRYLLARLALLAVGGLLLLRLVHARSTALTWSAATTLGVALPATWIGTGHANAEGSLLVGAVDTAHLAAMSAWFGGLVLLTFCVLSRTEPRPLAEVAGALPRFSRVATVCVTMLVATGTYQAWRGVGSLAALSGSAYGTLLVFKLSAVGVLLWLGSMSRSVVRRRYVLPAVRAAAGPAGTAGPAAAVAVPAARTAAGRRHTGTAVVSRTVRRADRAGRDQDELARKQLRWSVRAEVLIVVAVLGLTAMLVATPPATRPAAAEAAPVPEVASTRLALAGGGRVDVRLDPARVGASTLTVVVRDAAGAVQPVPEVSAAFRLPAQGLGPLPVPLTEVRPGEYASQGLSLPMAGNWELEIKVRTTDVDQTSVQTVMAVA